MSENEVDGFDDTEVWENHIFASFLNNEAKV